MSDPLDTSRVKSALMTRLRKSTPFSDAPPAPTLPLRVTHPVEGDLAERFKAEAERLTAKVSIVPNAEAAIEAVLTILAEIEARKGALVQHALTWETLPIPGLREVLIKRGMTLQMPNARHDSRESEPHTAESATLGITSAHAGIAATGTMVLVTGEGQGRLPSLLPPIHLALLPRTQLYGQIEHWLATEGAVALKSSNSVVFITGPSRTADIEMQTILGVHGPGQVYIVIF
jgi:L-lactate dehydrogenase complex protein LldG